MKTCPFCVEDIQDAAIVCKHCGRDLATGVAPSRPVLMQAPERAWSPGVAAVLSLAIPGAGQMYKGQVGVGLAFLFFTALGYMLYIIPGLVLHLASIITAASGSPVATRPVAATAPPAPLTPEERAQSKRQGRLILITLGVVALVAIVTPMIVTGVSERLGRRTTTTGTATYGGSPLRPAARYTLVRSQGIARLLVVTPEQAASDAELWAIADELHTKSLGTVQVMFWTSIVDAAAGLPMTDRQVETQVAQININTSTGFRELRRMPRGKKTAPAR